MPVRDWFRPPRQLMLAFLVVAVSSTATLTWLTWQLLVQDRAAEQQRLLEDRERAADIAAVAMERQLAALERRVESAASGMSADAPPPHTLVVSADAGRVAISPLGGVPYYPIGVHSPPVSSHALASAERLEFVDNNPEAAARAYRTLSTSDDVSLRAAALVRLARVERKRRAWPAGLAAYDRLAALGDIGVDDLPALLIARVGRASVFEQQPDAVRLRAEAARLSDDLAQGRLTITRSQYTFYAGQVRRWLGADPPVDADAFARADALGWLWEHRAESSGSGWRLVTIGTATTLVWRRSSQRPDQLSAIVLGPEALRAGVTATVPRGFAWALTDAEDRLVAGDRPPARASALRAAAATGLPGTLHVFAPASATPVRSPRYALLVSVLASVGALVLAGWYFIWRGVSREVRVARLQSDFVAAVSHEFRSPLTSLRHIADLLATNRMPSDGRRQRAYALLVNESDRLGRLVEGLLDFGRLQAGETAFRFEEVNAADLVRQIVDEFSRRLEPDGHCIVVAADTPSTIVIADREALGRVVWNLLDNAVKYSPERQQVRVRVASEPGGRRASIAVEDDGLGIPRTEHGRIFDRFVRGADAKARHIRGTGIGLAMAREIVRAHGGDISVRSEVGAGSVFTIEIPTLGSPGTAQDTPQHAELTSQGSRLGS